MKFSLKNASKNIPVLFAVAGLLALGFLFSWILLADHLWVSGILGVLLLGVLGLIIYANRQALKTRQAAFGLNSAITVLLVFAIVGLINFLGSRYPLKWDTTRNKINTLSDQTVKVVQGLKQEVKAVYYAKAGVPTPGKELLEKYKAINPKFVIEYVDPVKEPARTKQNEIRREGTVQLLVTAGEKTKKDKIEDVSEEKLTNSMIKLLREKALNVCVTTGHGEKNFSGTDQDGYEAVKKVMSNQNYDLKEITLLKDAKINADECNAVLMVGPTRAFFPAEIKAISDYLDQGGRLLVAADLDPKGTETMPEINELLSKWYIRFDKDLVIDPISRLANMDASVALTQSYAKVHPIGKEMNVATYFPLSRSIEIMQGAPAELKLEWVVRTSPTAWGETDFASISKGQIKQDPKSDKMQPLNLLVALDGKKKDSKAPKNTRIVAMGSANLANNMFYRAGGNADLFVNSVSWLLDEENLISIRAKEDAGAKIELSATAAAIILWITIVIAPLAICIIGIVIWVRRKKL